MTWAAPGRVLPLLRELYPVYTRTNRPVIETAVTLLTPRPRPASDPVDTVSPPITRRPPRHLAGTHVERDERGFHRSAGTVGEHAAGLLDDFASIDSMPAPVGSDDGPDGLVHDLTMAMQSYASMAPIVRYSELIPFLARTLVDYGWVEAELA